jgi:hypothetical protein
MNEESNAPRANVLEWENPNGAGAAEGGGDDSAAGKDESHGRAADIRAGVVAATEKSRDVADRAVGLARDQVEQHREVVERAVNTSGKAARAAGQQAKRHPRIAGGLAAGGAVLLAAGRVLRGRRRTADTAGADTVKS